ncbi:MAG: rhodanese-like domain-containing protein [Taibaiella sp.]|nr:rhodanese-like domain-containing protein [Taibaiella sp.]
MNTNKSINYKELLNNGALVIDVRTREEYSGGHFSGSFNLPLDTIEMHAPDLKLKNKPIILVCRSGARSGAAAGILGSMDIETYNGGGWDAFEQAVKN